MTMDREPPGAPRVPRVCVIVCDSWGVGDAPDAAAYGDEGSDTLGNVSRAVGGLRLPNLEGLGIGHLTPLEGVSARADPGTAWGRATEVSAGKDTTTGHWEMMGIALNEPFPLFPDGFPPGGHRAVRGEDRSAHPRERPRVGNGDHRRAGGGASADRASHRVHERGQRVPDRVPSLGRLAPTAL